MLYPTFGLSFIDHIALKNTQQFNKQKLFLQPFQMINADLVFISWELTMCLPEQIVDPSQGAESQRLW